MLYHLDRSWVGNLSCHYNAPCQKWCFHPIWTVFWLWGCTLYISTSLRRYLDIAFRSKIIERAYKIKTITRLCVSTLFIYFATREILISEIFVFEFVCNLESNPASELQAMPTPVHYCVNLNAPVYTLLIWSFAAFTAVNWIAAAVALLVAFKLIDKKSMQRQFKFGRNKKDNDQIENGQGEQIDTTSQFLNVVILDRNHPRYSTPVRYFWKDLRSHNDYEFLMFLLSQTSNSMYMSLKVINTF